MAPSAELKFKENLYIMSEFDDIA